MQTEFMEVQTVGKNIYLTDGLREHLKEKLKPLERLGVESVHLTIDGYNQKQHIVVAAKHPKMGEEVIRVSRSNNIHENDTTYQMIDFAISALTEEVRNRSQKASDRSHGVKNTKDKIDTIRKADNTYEDEQEAIAEMDEGIY